MTQSGPTPNERVARTERARRLLTAGQFDLLLATPGTNFLWLTGAPAHRMERLIAFLLPREGQPTIVCPAFERDNLARSVPDAEFVVWEESEDPWGILATALVRLGGPRARVTLEPTTWYWMAERMRAAAGSIRFGDGSELFATLRSIKSAEEIDRIRRATALAEVAARHVRLHLEVGMTEREAAAELMEILRQGEATHDPLVQFGAATAIPHAEAGDTPLRRGDMVLFDLSATVDGYVSDITRMTCFGDATPEMKSVYQVVLEAQQAAIAAIRPGVACQEIDRAARRVIVDAGFGDYFTHRTGHGIGMDIHEAPWLVEGNEMPLEAGQVMTIEPGIYLPGRFGIRIEDDLLVTETGSEVLSEGAPELLESIVASAL